MMNLKEMVYALRGNTLAEAFSAKWDCDEGTLQFWRASSNVVYHFESSGIKQWLRFSSASDHQREQLEAELHFMMYLKDHGFPCVSLIASQAGEYLEELQTEEGIYYAVVFSEASGDHIYRQPTEEEAEQWGRALAELHELSQRYEHKNSGRKHWSEILNDAEKILQRHPEETVAKQELALVREELEHWTEDETNIGLVHYDFQLDNVMFEDGCISDVIDFDDTMVHFYMMDLVRVLEDDCDEQGRYLEDSEERVSSFLKGYGSVRTIPEDWNYTYAVLRRFERVHGYTRLLCSLERSEEVVNEAPAWYDGLVQKFRKILAEEKIMMSESIVGSVR
ncbi:phosphotransferase [Paenibacillus sp. Marseille-Q4541]|uniref:phosphotransferase enzyme family protein n=1 Tax=Paenibacillus sp. Marseille-Q4541 TaxID=2831522 RepID=UPI001BAB8955|nr:phosphotransferase [Paenibacillus sp. Marseille-Q4541]